MSSIALNVVLNKSCVYSGTNLNASIFLDSFNPETVNKKIIFLLA